MNFDYQGYIIENHSRFFEFWCLAVNADLSSDTMYESGDKRAARQLVKEHEKYWRKYQTAMEVVFNKCEKIEDMYEEFQKIQEDHPEIFQLFVKSVNISYDATLWFEKGRNRKARELNIRAEELLGEYITAAKLLRNY